ncbi:MAG TPA: Crp/Fnr family transcriptional regulator [Clostridiales bacterium]|nr:Crp/Fnr family transcriptional regulator [Clostridiales bacterium]
MNQKLVTLEEIFPCFHKLTPDQQESVRQAAEPRLFIKGSKPHQGGSDCAGLFLVRRGRLRAYILSESGKEVTLYRLYSWDMCMFSASCIMKNIHFDIHVEAETDTDVFIVPAELFENLQKASLPLANYTNQLMAARFSDVMWVMEQIIFKSLDSRIATLLLEQSAISDSEILDITHDAIARHLGTAREVVTRALKYLAAEGMVSVSRGKITILHLNKLTKLAEG